MLIQNDFHNTQYYKISYIFIYKQFTKHCMHTRLLYKNEIKTP
jgi:hypothetical protein